ncbi:MAG: metallophosphoesterase family protein [Candidatus Thermoplasmatota archaeon]|nr:metallophosphoesterase family protein [Candidatus Thermoplasmatota archaeon]
MGNMLFDGPVRRMERIYSGSPGKRIDDSDRIVIFSDMHMGNKGRADDFKDNAHIFKTAMTSLYVPEDFDLIMNGDIEELHKFRPRSVMDSWKGIYEMFNGALDRGGLDKISGNHDHRIWHTGVPNRVSDIMTDGLKLRFGSDTIFVMHGHQASLRAESLERWVHYGLRYGASPIGLKNYSFPHESELKFRIEERVYDFSKRKRIMTIIGHTHRPLFESMSRADSLKFKLERLLRDYTDSTGDEKARIERNIHIYHAELERLLHKNPRPAMRESLYNRGVLVPNLFNSGSCIGRKGITALEIENGRISLVYWFDADRSTKYFNYNGFKPQRAEGSSIYRVVLKEEDLSYIFSRINLLS